MDSVLKLWKVSVRPRYKEKQQQQDPSDSDTIFTVIRWGLQSTGFCYVQDGLKETCEWNLKSVEQCSFSLTSGVLDPGPTRGSTVGHSWSVSTLSR